MWSTRIREFRGNVPRNIPARVSSLWAAAPPRGNKRTLRFGAKRVRPHRGRTLFTRRFVRGIFRHVHAVTKNDSDSFRRHWRRKPGRGFGPFLDFSQDGRGRFAARWGRGTGAPVGCLLLLRVPAVRLAAERHCRREGRCGGGTRDGGRRADASLRTLGTKDGRIRCAVRRG